MWVFIAALALTAAGVVFALFEFGRAAVPLWAACALAGLLLWRSVLLQAHRRRRDNETARMLRSIHEQLAALEEAAERQEEWQRQHTIAQEENADPLPPDPTAEQLAAFLGIEPESSAESES